MYFLHEILNKINILAYTVEPIFYKIIYMSVTAILIFGFIKLLQAIFKDKLLPKFRMMMWLVLIVSLAVPYRFESSVSVNENISKIQDISFREEYDEISYKEIIETQNPENSVEYIENLSKQEDRMYIKSLVFDVILPLSWLVGIFVSFGFSFVSLRKLKSDLIEADKESILYNSLEKCCDNLELSNKYRIFYSDKINSPAVLGVFSPKILLPYYIDVNEKITLENILMHELSHIKRKDHILNGILLLLQNIYWFNPIVKMMFRDMRNDMEFLNDEYVIKHSDDAKTYIKSLIWVLAQSNGLSYKSNYLCMTDGAKNLERRINMIKNNKNSRNRIIASLAAIVLMFGFSACVMSEKSSANQDVIFPAYVSEVTLTDGDYALSDFMDEINNFPKFRVKADFPENWKFTFDSDELPAEWVEGHPYVILPMSELYTKYFIVEDDEVIGYIGFSIFEPYEDEIPPESFYKTVWPELRLSSMCIWEPFTSVKRTETFESGVCDIDFVDYTKMSDDKSMAEIPHIKTKGVLAYDKDIKAYIGIAFAPEKASEEQIAHIAETINFELVK